jgi:hypothetical protein
MKRELFNNPSRLILNALLLTFAIASCTKENSIDLLAARSTEIAKAQAAGKPGTTTEVPLRMTISDASGNKITSDGGGDYVNGSQNMRVVFDQYGSLIFDNRKSQGKPAVRFYLTNLDNPVEVFIDPGFTNGIVNYMAMTKSSLFPSVPLIQNMAIGASQCITFHGGAGEGYVFSFHGGIEDESGSPTSFASITRNSATEWTMTPGSCATSLNTDVASIRQNGTLYGYYHMPFTFTFTKL